MEIEYMAMHSLAGLVLTRGFTGKITKQCHHCGHPKRDPMVVILRNVYHPKKGISLSRGIRLTMFMTYVTLKEHSVCHH